MQKVFRLAAGAAGPRRVSVALHRVGGALVLDGALDERLEPTSWGDVDPETGEIIVMVAKGRRPRPALAAPSADAANDLEGVELVAEEDGAAASGEPPSTPRRR